MDRGEDGAHHRACDGHLGQLEGDGAGVTHDTRPDLDQLELEAGQRPVGHGLGQFDAAQEGGQVVGVTSRQVVWLFFKQLWFEFVPVLHGLQGRFTAQG